MAGDGTLRLRAHAKLNLGLAVLGKRPDGYHEIDTIFARLELHDELRLQPAAGLGGELLTDTRSVGADESRAGPTISDAAQAGPAQHETTQHETTRHGATQAGADLAGTVETREAAAGPGPGGLKLQGLRMDRNNLAMRAASAYLAAAPGVAGAHIGLLKRIPVAAGLGGGSADAAAVLRGLETLFPAQVDLPELALSLGSDVPFFLAGLAGARAGGRGERLEPASVPRLPVVLVNPGVAISAAAAYRDLRESSPPLDASAVLRRLAGGEEPGYRNSLQAGVVAQQPLVAESLEALREARLHGVLMSGSGATCFGVAGSLPQARAAATRVRGRHPGWWVWSGWAGV
jgi:4-diphosphocytidyl-2-C-methyl-D-erythritol kinase